ncbi:MAG: energy transducer TonB, partial [Opitutaceae bacterium]|nr:energy transducer TonB [Opitutaceae bacterium]
MRLDLIIAIFISAALHAAFAYGDKIIALFWHPAPQIQQVAEEEKVIQIKTMPEDLIEPPEPVDSNEEVSQEQISFVPPMQADVPSPQIDNSFQQALQPPPPPTHIGQTAIAIPTGPNGP